MMRLAILSCLILALFMPFIQVDTAQACSGGVPYDYWDLQYVLDSPVIVTGRINAVSESGRNAILRIEHILHGEISHEYIAFSRNTPPSLQLVDAGRGMLFQCDTLGSQLPAGRRFIAGLHRTSEGYYEGAVTFSSPEGMFSARNQENLAEYLSFTYEELLTYSSQILGEAMRQPQDNKMPRAGSVRLLTESGNVYSLPIDSTIPVVSGSVIDCTTYQVLPCADSTIAPNGIDNFTFFPVGSDLSADRYSLVTHYPFIEGETGVFSPFSDIVAVWVGQEIRLYTTINQLKLYPSLSRQAQIIHTREFNPNDQLISGSGAWSPNGRTFALSSESGVWLWDILSENSQPVLFLEATDTPILVRHFSPMGNYLALTAGDRNYHVDIHSLAEYPDGVFAPDDRVLAAFDTTASTLTPLDVYTMVPEFISLLGIGNLATGITQLEWINGNTYIYAGCGEATRDQEMQPYFEQDWCKVIRSTIGTSIAPREYIDGILFDYDPVTDSIVTLIDETIITFNGEIISLADVLDERIIGVEIIPAIDLNHRNF